MQACRVQVQHCLQCIGKTDSADLEHLKKRKNLKKNKFVVKRWYL